MSFPLDVYSTQTPLFCDTALAERVERAEAQLMAEASWAAHRRNGGDGGFVLPIAGGVATFAEPGSPFNKVAGLGFAGTPSPAELAEIEQAFAAREFDAWLGVVADGFAQPDTQGVASHEDFPRDVIARAERDFAAAGVVRYLALRDGVPAGGASLRIADGVAQLAGSATAPAHRRRGIQNRTARRPADRCRGRRGRHRGGHHPTWVEVPRERTTARL